MVEVSYIITFSMDHLTCKCFESNFFFFVTTSHSGWTLGCTTSYGWQTSRCWKRRRGTDQLTGVQEGRDVEEIEHYEQKARRPKFNWILKKRESGCVGAWGGGVSGLVHIKLWGGEWSGSCTRKLLDYPRGLAGGGGTEGAECLLCFPQSRLSSTAHHSLNQPSCPKSPSLPVMCCSDCWVL